MRDPFYFPRNRVIDLSVGKASITIIVDQLLGWWNKQSYIAADRFPCL